MWKVVTALAMSLLLGGCASMNQVMNDVTTYNVWPADRKPGTYAFERLPSQQANAQQQQVLEDSAARALELAGFTAAADPKAADVSVTLGARVSANQGSPYDDPFWWRGGLWAHHFYRPYWRPGFGPYFGHPFGPFGPWGYPYYNSTTYEREVALLIRDRRTAQPLYEVRVINDGYSPSIGSLLSGMFEAGLKDFPYSGQNPRRVVTQLGA
jgi:hypothetical protein